MTPVWAAIAEGEEKQRQAKLDGEENQRLSVAAEIERRRQEMRNGS
jgi:hypothetical protein